MSKMAILLAGNLTDGFKAYGPFGDHDAATQYAWDSGIQAHEKNWVLELTCPTRDYFAPDCPLHVVMAGDPLQGWKALGPFAAFDDADDWANKYVSGETWVLPLLNPETGK